jgi:dihydroorotate dehydrogenase electron transfer subunit
MFQRIVAVSFRNELAPGIFVVRFRSQEIASSAAAGQFVNIRCGDGCLPLLRRPMSISRLVGDEVELLFNVVGQGTRMLAAKRAGDMLDVLGPLGVPFGSRGDFSTAVIVAGGVGVAPFPFLTTQLAREGKQVITFLGARTAAQLTPQNLENVQLATDDGTQGYCGTVIGLLEAYLSRNALSKPKIFGCGPTNMLKALSGFAKRAGIECELSLEGDMACGLGLCQGCPIERANGEKKYALVCTEGPTFNSKDIILR